jgi:hypothetical protein
MVKEVELPNDKNIKNICDDLMRDIARLPLKDNPELQKKVREAWEGKYKRRDKDAKIAIRN